MKKFLPIFLFILQVSSLHSIRAQNLVHSFIEMNTKGDSDFGYSVSSAGDVNFDGFADVIIGAQNVLVNTGRAYIFFGGNNMDNIADVILNGEKAENFFGCSVSSAGDVNNDNFDDVIVGAYANSSSKGRAYIYYGGSNMNNVADVTLTGEANDSELGFSVASAGDVNKDGYNDVIVGAQRYSSNTGRAYLYLGSNNMDNIPDLTMTGEGVDNYFGVSVSSGDLNNDGYSDLLVGADAYNSYTGRAYVYFGGNVPDNSPDVVLDGGSAYNYFGHSISAGDVNNDGFDDILVGAYRYNSYMGRAYVYYGGSSVDNTADVVMEGETTESYFGHSVSCAGDVNNDGYDDIIVGAHGFDSNKGRTYIYYGSGNMNNIADVVMTGAGEDSYFGISVSKSGDINNDGFNDILIGARGIGLYTDNAFICYGANSMDNTSDVTLTGESVNNYLGCSVSNAGDVNNDGYDDIIVGAYGYNSYTGRAYIYYGGESSDNVADVILSGEEINSYFGCSVSNAGDINNDGFDDVIVGARGYNMLTGRSYVYYGGSNMDNTPDLVMTGEGFENLFGVSVSTAGDVNNDGYADIIVGARGYDSYTGRAYIYFGGANMNNTADVTLTGEASYIYLGFSVSSAGDVNNDGFDDVIVGSYRHNTYTGRACIYLGGSTMDNTADITMFGEEQFNYFGYVVSGAGDVNNDGYDDVIVSSPRYNYFTGRVYLFYGGVSMDNIADVVMTGEDYDNYFGFSLSHANDLNNDGFDDIIIGAQNNFSAKGRVFLYYGNTNMDNVPDITLLGETSGSRLGCSVSSGGDINNDGYEDLLVADYVYANNGKVYLYSLKPQPTLVTHTVSNLTSTTAVIHSEIKLLGISNPTAHGVCWNNSGSPLISDNRTNEGAKNNIGEFTSTIINMTFNTRYYARAYAINSAGVSYGEEISFTTLKENQTLNFNSLPEQTYGIAPFDLSVSTNSGLPVTFISSNTSVAEIDGNKITIIGAGSTIIKAFQEGNSSYYPVEATQTLTINKAPLTIKADNKTKTYGEDNPVFTLNYTGFVNGEDADDLTTVPIVNCTANASTAAGTVPITVAGGISGNYNFSYENGTLTINKAPLTVKADNKTKTYGEDNPAFTLNYTGFVNGEDADDLTTVPTLNCTANASTGAGTVPITVAGCTSGNYNFSYENGTLTINKAPLMVKADNKTKTYGEDNPAFTLNYTGFVNSEDADDLTTAPTLHSTANASTGAGTVPITVAGGISGNYNFSYENGTLTINKAPLRVKADNKTKTYGEDNPAFTLNYNGFVNGEDADDLTTVPTLNSTANASTGAGTVPITVAGGTSGNYNFSYENGILTINKAPLMVKADNKAKKHGEDNPLFTLTFIGFANNDLSSDLEQIPTISTNATAESSIGNYSIILSDGRDDNYELIYTNGILEITSSTDVRNIESLEIFIYPNPTKDYLIINCDDYKKSDNNLKIYNSLGKLVIDTKLTESKIDVASLGAGIYFIKLKGNTLKFIKE